MALKAKAGSGSVARTMHTVHDGTPRSLRRGRPPKELAEIGEFQSAYEAARIEEIKLRAELFRLRAGKLSGELLDRRLVISELAQIFGAIRDVILASSKMTDRQKQDLLHTLAEIPIVVSPGENRVS